MRQTNKTCFSCLTHQVILILVQASMFHLCSKFLLLIEAEILTYVVTRFHIVEKINFNIVGYQWNLLRYLLNYRIFKNFDFEIFLTKVIFGVRNFCLEWYTARSEDKERILSIISRNPDKFLRIYKNVSLKKWTESTNLDQCESRQA